jgi:hypothetical protein
LWTQRWWIHFPANQPASQALLSCSNKPWQIGHYCKESFSFAGCSTRLLRTSGDYRRRCKLNPELISTGLLQLFLCNKILLSSLNGFFFFLIIISSSLSLSLSTTTWNCVGGK